MALRGHASIQGSTDIPTLYDLLPGYLHMPKAREGHLTLEDYIDAGGADRGWWSFFDPYIISLLKAWFGDAATAENDYGFAHVPKLTGNHSHFATMLRALDGGLDGLFVMGQNPAVGSQHAGLQRRALAKLKWLVVRDMAEIETATFWRDSPEVQSGELRPEDDPDRGVPDARRLARREGGDVHEYPAPGAVPRQGARTRRATRARSCGSCTTWPSGSRLTTRAPSASETGRS